MSRPTPPNPTDSVSADDPTERTFTIGQVLSVARGNLAANQIFCTWGEFLDVVGYLLNDVPSLGGDPSAEPPIPPMSEVVAQRARPAVLEQHPTLAGVKAPAVLASDTEVLAWLVEQERKHGERLMLRPVETRAP